MATYRGTAGNDTRTGSNNNNTFLDYGQGADSLTGGNRNDKFVLTVDQWADTINGGAGRDTLDYSNADRGLSIDMQGGVTMAVYTVPGIWGHLPASLGGPLGYSAVTTSFANIEDVVGSRFNDRIFGSDGDNVIEGGGGADLIDGRQGNDTASYANSSQAVYVNLGSPQSLQPGIGIGGDAQGDRLYSIENLIGSDHNDVLVGNELNNVFTGGEGSDTFVFGSATGHDTITDFDARGNDHDTIQISRSVFANFDELWDHVEDTGDDVVINLDGNNSITLQDVRMQHLDASDFSFV